MGFDRQSQIGVLHLAFEADELAGLEIIYRRPTVDALAAVLALDDYDPIDHEGPVDGDELVRLRPVCAELAGLLLAWNLEENGKAVPFTPAAFLGLDAKFVLAVTKTWARVSVGLPQLVAEVVELPEPNIDPGEIPVETLAAS